MNQETAYDTEFSNPRAERAEIAFGRQTDGSGERHVGRFSEGIERRPEAVHGLYIGSFGDRDERVHKRAA